MSASELSGLIFPAMCFSSAVVQATSGVGISDRLSGSMLHLIRVGRPLADSMMKSLVLWPVVLNHPVHVFSVYVARFSIETLKVSKKADIAKYLLL